MIVPVLTTHHKEHVLIMNMGTSPLDLRNIKEMFPELIIRDSLWNMSIAGDEYCENPMKQ